MLTSVIHKPGVHFSASVSTWETHPMLLDQVRETVEIEFDTVLGREGKNLFWIKRRLPTGQFREVTLKPGRRDDFQDARWRIARIPEGMPLIGWLEDQLRLRFRTLKVEPRRCGRPEEFPEVLCRLWRQFVPPSLSVTILLPLLFECSQLGLDSLRRNGSTGAD
jgi:hypothetical protein